RELRYSTRLTGGERFVREHVVQGRGVVPAVVQLEWARAAVSLLLEGHAGRMALTLRDVVWLRPLIVEEALEVHITLAHLDDGRIGYEIYSGKEGEEIVYGQGYAQTSPPDDEECEAVLPDTAAWRHEQAQSVDIAGVYQRFERSGLRYGQGFHVLREVWVHDETAVGLLAAGPAALNAGYSWLPMLLDGALQTAGCLSPDAGLMLPFSVREVKALRPLSSAASVRVSPARHGAEAAQASQQWDITVLDEQGLPAIYLNGFSMRRVKAEEEAGLLLARPVWETQAPDEHGTQAGAVGDRWVLACGVTLPPALADKQPAARCIACCPDEGDIAQRYTGGAQRILTLLRNEIANVAVERVTAQLLVPATGEAEILRGLGALLRSAQQEYPNLFVQVLAFDDINAFDASRLHAMLCAEAPARYAEVRYTDGRRETMRWETAAAPDEPGPIWRDGGVYWITGGVGGIARHLASMARQQAAKPILILSDIVTAPDELELLQKLRAGGATVEIDPVDVSDGAAMAACVARLVERYGRINGIVHCAGILRDRLIQQIDAAELTDVFVPKVQGAIALDQAVGDLPLDWMILCSSLAAVWGNLGQASYAGANAFMDHFAAYRQSLVNDGKRQGRTLSLNWPLWTDGGMQADEEKRAWLARHAGLQALPSGIALPAQEQALSMDGAQIAILYGAPSRLRQLLNSGETERRVRPAEGGTAAGEVQEQVARRYLSQLLAQTLKIPAERIDPQAPLEQYGIDSVMSVSLVRDLEEVFGPLPVTLFFEYQNIAALTQYFIQHHAGTLGDVLSRDGRGRPPVTTATASGRRYGRHAQPRPSAPAADGPWDIAIVGLSGRYPGAEDINTFWDNLSNGVDSITEIPAGRWDWQRDFDSRKGIAGKSYSKWGGFIDGMDRFDPLFFGMSPLEAEKTDPQERLFLQCAYHAVEDAGYTRDNLVGSDRLAGVFVGVMYQEYQLYGAQAQARGDNLVLLSSAASIANRVSYFCNFQGPSIAVDTMCSSSLSAIHLACQSLRQGECRVAIAGGVNVSLHPNKYLQLSQGQFASSTGRCTSFAAGGDGYVPGEGVGAVVLKSLHQAIADGDHIYGVIKGSALNHGGKTNGYTVPNPVAQSRVISRALDMSGVDARRISYIEAHGTGTSLGDPIEIRALSQAFGERTRDTGFCAIGSVKSNIGHCESAAGIAGLSKLLLQMRHQRLVKSLHSEELNPYISFADTPFVVQRENAPWPCADGMTRIAGLSSFGAGGSNAHLIVEEYRPAQDIPAESDGEQVIVLSARLAGQLHTKVVQLSDYLRRHEINLADLAWTLQTGREAMAVRLALVVTSQQQLLERLDALQNGGEGGAGVYQGEAAPLADAAPHTGGDADTLAAAWAGGATIDWNALHPAQRPRRLSLPLYPFARERCWGVPDFGASVISGGGRLHPLIESNISDLHQQRYCTRLNGEAWFLREHVVQGNAIVPAAVQLEWARAAVSLALEGVADRHALCLCDVAWLQPLAVVDTAQVNISLAPLSGGDIEYRIYSGDDGEPQVYSQGRASLPAADSIPTLDLAALRGRCGRSLDGAALYQRFEQVGLHYGPAFNVLKRLHIGDGLVVAELVATDGTLSRDYTWLPDMLDGALQSCAGMMNDGDLALPFSLKKIESRQALSATAWAVIRTGAGDTPALRKLDIDITDERGTVALRLQGYATRPAVAGDAAQQASADDVGALSFVPAWQTADEPETPQASWLQPYEIILNNDPTPAQITGMLGAEETIRHLLWRPDGLPEPVIAGLRLVRALLDAGYGKQPLALTVITTQGVAVFDHEQADPQQSSVHGLIGVLAKEYPHWQVRLLDLPAGGAVDCDWQSQPADPQGNTRAWREGRWYQQCLLPVQPDMPAAAQAPYRQGGVYVVLGGAGGLGVAWSEDLIRRYQAQLIWLGRREEDDAIRSQCERLSEFGPRPLYLRADAADAQALDAARETIVARFGAIHGVVHATIVLADRTLAMMDEPCFAAVLQAKTVTADNMDAVFGALPLDFMLFFSSIQSLSRSLGQSNYAAGCCYIDALAHNMRSRAYPVKVMSWGYWGGVGVVAQDSYRARMAQLGFGSIEPEDAMPALERLLAYPGGQMAFVKTTRAETTRLLSRSARSEIILAPRACAGEDYQVAPSSARLALIDDALPQLTVLETQLMPLLWAQLAQLGWLDEQTSPPRYRSWRDAALALLRGAGVNTDEPAPLWQTVWAQWQHWSQTARENPVLGAQIRLAETTLSVLCDVLGGNLTATEVIFPQGQADLVEAVYRGHPVADAFNELLADQLVAWLQARQPQEPVRILEIGAGTGGTSAVLFERLAPWAGQIAEYAYTDVSGAFLVYARTRFQQRIPYLNPCLFDVERSPAEQNLMPGSYDIVVASNVLHATRDIRNTVNNAKALLKNNGLLLINEIAAPSVFAHLTFGLLDGWWLAQDAPLRLNGTPALSAASWRQVLEDAGFCGVVMPENGLHVLGQQIIRATSNGVIRLGRTAVGDAVSTAPPPSAADDDLKAAAVRRLRHMVAETLKMPAAQVKAEEPLSVYGVDSILAVRVAQALGEVFDGVDATLLFEHPSIDALAGHFTATQREATQRWLGIASPAPASERAAVRSAGRFIAPLPAKAASGARDVAIVGLSGRYPNAATLEQYWENLRDGVDCISEIPAQRWDWRRDFDERKGTEGKSYSKWGGFIDDADAFDPQFFGIAPREAERMDPQERLLLQYAWSALEDAGYTPATLAPQGRAGVFIGAMNSHYTVQPVQWSLANRISYLFNLRGPSLAVDTACSSSLTAIHLALESLRQGEIDCAIAGGVNLIVDPVQYQTLSAMTMLSTDSQCRAFGEGADGFVDAEGVGVAVLKPLARAVEDGDHIYGVIKGSALNHCGKTGGFTVPDPKAQADVIERALSEAGVDARCVSYVEAHGSGTALGDPIEISGLTRAFRQHTQDKGFCAIGSVKASIGHCESAAGIAGLTKVLMQMQHGQIAKSLHSETLNPHIDFRATPFTVQQQTQPWPRPVVTLNGVEREYPRIAGVSSFGAGGANAHLIVEEYPAAQPDTATDSPVIVVLSARRGERLQAYMQQLLAYLERHTVNLRDLAYTLQVGRAEMAVRIALVADSQAALIGQLRQVLQGDTLPPQVYRGEVKSHQDLLALFSSDDEMHEVMKRWMARGKLNKLAECWANGVSIDWQAFHSGTRPVRLSLPTYPFARESYWQPQRRLNDAPAGFLHPLLHRNTSDFSQQRYSTRLMGAEWFIGPRRTVPAAVLLEWARAAVSLARGASDDGTCIALHDVNGLQTLSVDRPREVQISLVPQDDGRIAWEIYDDTAEPAQVFCRGYASFIAGQEEQVVDVAALRAQMSQRLDAPALYAGADGAGDAFRALRFVSRCGERILGRLETPRDHDNGACFWPMAALDGVLQVSDTLWDGGAHGDAPFTINDIYGWDRLPACAWVIVSPVAQNGSEPCSRDITVTDDQGRIVLHLAGVHVETGNAGAERLLAIPEWTPQALPPLSPFAGQHELLVCETALPPGLNVVSGVDHCIVLSAEGTLAQRYDDYVRQLLEHVRRITALPERGPVMLQLLLPAYGAGEAIQGLAAFMRVVACEYPSLATQTVLMDDAAGYEAEHLAQLLKAEAASSAPVVRYSAGRREVPAWLTPENDGDAPLPWRDGGVYWITGGLGGLGRQWAAAIARQANPVLILSGRSADTPEQDAFIRTLRERGAVVEFHALDVSDREAVRQRVNDIVARHGRLNGVIHCAGVLRDRLVPNITQDDLRQGLAAKTRGVEIIDEATRSLELDWLILCSSLAGAWGNIGQSVYAAANGFMDGYARYRQALTERGERHGRTLSVGWPLWAGGGMQLEAGRQAQLFEHLGMVALPTDDALAALAQLLRQPAAYGVVLYGRRHSLCQWLHQPVSTMPEQPAEEIRHDVPEADHDLAQRIEQQIGGMVMAHLKLPAEALDRDTSFNDLGFDSVSLTAFGNMLNARYGLMLTPSVFFTAPTLGQFAGYLAREHAGAFAAPDARRPASVLPSLPPASPLRRDALPRIALPANHRLRAAPVTAREREAIAVIGMSGSFPQSADIDALWENLMAGRDCIGELPAERWPGPLPALRHAGVLDGMTEFDPLFFGISPREAQAMDPQQRLLMTYVHHVIEDAGYSVRSLSGSNTALLVATGSTGYGNLMSQAGSPITGYSAIGVSDIMGPNRMSYWLDWHGPSNAIDTACSSSLIAVHRAIQLLRTGQCDQAVVGGINTLLSLEVHESFIRAGMLSPNGRCRTFSGQADGYVRGEGVGMLMLKPLSAAQRDGDHVYGLLLGSAENHGGRAASLTAPNPLAQEQVIVAAHRQAGTDLRSVGYIEAHGTGTPLGDPIEIEGIRQAFRTLAQEQSLPAASCGVGSVKSHVGHLELAAGVAGLIKIILQLRHRKLVANLNCLPLNPNIRLEDGPLYVVSETRDWQAATDEKGRPLPRSAGVSSFGFGGVNAHVVVQEYQPPQDGGTAVMYPLLIVLSARTAPQLHQRVMQLHDYLERQDVNLADLAWTLQAGRDAMAHRLALVVHSAQDLNHKLQCVLKGGAIPPDTYQGEIKPRKGVMTQFGADEDLRVAVQSWIAKGKLSKLAEFWVQGLEVDWPALHRDKRACRLSLPTYPFARDRYWLPEAQPQTQPAPPAGGSGLYPDAPDSGRQRYSTTLTGREWFLRDHVVQGQPIVPGVVQ
ncbi:SDR family NAD(P)-dependent oxidoreductase, partial [Enterobacillus tribolii]|uniref:SDR family NAD(P)-dependent oxidoreductase n=1 Tax=Enterobacillus tribolii TaxID=1487935 RepID=UPI000E1C70DD